MQQLDEVEVNDNLDRFEGWLFKWANFFNGYLKRWFVLSEGHLSYFLTKEDIDVSCRGKIVVSAVTIVQEDSLHFTVTTANGVNLYLRASSAANCQRWIKALHLANSISLLNQVGVGSAANSNRNGYIGPHDGRFINWQVRRNDGELQRAESMLGKLDAKLGEVETLNTNITKHGSELCAVLKGFETTPEVAVGDLQKNNANGVREKLNVANETAKVLQNSCSNLVTACTEFLQIAKTQTQNLKSIVANDSKSTGFTDENEFSEDEDDFLDASDISVFQTVGPEIVTPHKDSKYRKSIPFKPDYRLNLWAALKNFIGKDLTKLPVPVNFNEPISMLQKLAEDFDHSELLEKAAMCKDSSEQMAWVVAFSVSSNAPQAYRTGKPFNPMLGETFESDRSNDRGYKLVVEQVCHQPPRGAMHVHSTREDLHGGWSYWTDVLPSSSFRGNYLTLRPVGLVHLKFHATGNYYTWNKPNITVNNIILGKLWIDLTGESNFVNHTTGDKCRLTYHQFSYFSSNPFRKISGTISDKNDIQQYFLSGTWDSVLSYRKLDPWSKSDSKDVLLWRVCPLPPLSNKMYDFNYFTMTLNEWEDGTAPTDSRRRPDQQKMEEAEWDDANVLKMELEERQRHRRKLRETDDAERKKIGLPIIPYQPCWFKKSRCEISGENTYQYTHEYWEAKKSQDWSRSVNIFDLSGESYSSSSNFNWPDLVKSYKKPSSSTTDMTNK